MAITYDEILETMENKYYELSGNTAERAGDIGIRLKLLAGELYALSSNIDWLRQQMFPDTATGECLDLHAKQCGLSRRAGSKARGNLVFRLDNPIEYDVTIPAGTVCSTADGSLRYITTRSATIQRGMTLAVLECLAEKTGEEYNLGAGKVKTIVTYFSAGISIGNSSSFSGGTNDEDDESLRNRIFYAMSNPANGANAEFYRSIAVSTEGIQSAEVYPVSGQAMVCVCLGGKGALPSDDAVSQVRDKLQLYKNAGVNVSTFKATAVNVNVSVQITAEDEFYEVQTQTAVHSRIQDFFNALSVGENVTAAALGKAIMEVDGVENYAFSGMSDVSVSHTQLALLGQLTVTMV